MTNDPQMISDSDKKLSSNLSTVAIAVTVAMLPGTILWFITNVTNSWSPAVDELYKIITGLEIIFSLFGACFLFGIGSNSNSLNVSKPGFTLCGIGLSLLALKMVVFLLYPSLQFKLFNHYFESGLDSGIIKLLSFNAILFAPLIIGTSKLTKQLPAMRGACYAYIFMMLLPLISFIIEILVIRKRFAYYGYDYTGIDTYMILVQLITLIIEIVCVVSWWRAAGQAKNMRFDVFDAANTGDNGATNADNNGGTSNSSAADDQAVAPKSHTAETKSSAAEAKTSSAGAITEEQRNLIMGMSNEELTKVIDNPMLYTNKAFVEEARTTWLKRRAWEMIKDYTDAQLIDIVHNNTQGFAYEVLDAASMELFARDNEAFVSEVEALSDDELEDIVDNPYDNFDGYVRLASRVLNQRRNNPSKE